jgi:two-component system CheB/CheR fusion protein
MDLISCRNLLIYLEQSLQKKVFPTFHYALKPEGFLLLGASESIGGFTELFEPADKKHKLYCKKAAPTPAFHLPVKREQGDRLPTGLASSSRDPLSMGRGKGEGRTGEGGTGEGGTASEIVRGELNAQREADRITVNQFAPPGVLVNADLQILQFRGPTSAYLEPPTGKASFDVLKMAREGLRLPLRAAINKAKKDNSTARKDHVRVQQNGTTRTVNVQVIPLKNVRERCFLILFEDAEAGRAAAPAPSPPQPSRATRTGRPGGAKEESRRIADLETNLADTRDYLQSILEQHEAANEELQASNEEVQSANEELQSVNEELETSKEELESANEELTTINEEMVNRNAELTRLNSDLVNLQTSIKLGIVLLGRDLTIRRFSAQAETVFNLLANDVGRPIGNIRHNLIFEDLQDPETRQGSRKMKRSEGYAADLETFIADVIADVRERGREVRDKEGRWYSLNARPYFTLDNKVDGAVLVLVDLTDLKRSQLEIQAARNYADAVIRTVPSSLIVLRADLRVNTANDAFYNGFKTTPDQTEGRLIYELGNRQWDIPKLRQFLEDIVPRNSFFNDFEVEHDFPQIGRRSMLLNARRLDLDGGSPPLILLAIEDVTERLRAEMAVSSLAAIVNSSDDAIIGKDVNGVITSWNHGAEGLFGYTAQEAVGRPITMLMPPDRLHEEADILARIKRGERIVHFDTVRVRKNRSPVDISLTISPITDATGRVIGASKIARDITERKRAEEALEQSHAELQAHAEELARFNSAAVGRELRMIELKQEINELCRRQGEPARYPLDFEQGSESAER